MYRAGIICDCHEPASSPAASQDALFDVCYIMRVSCIYRCHIIHYMYYIIQVCCVSYRYRLWHCDGRQLASSPAASQYVLFDLCELLYHTGITPYRCAVYRTGITSYRCAVYRAGIVCGTVTVVSWRLHLLVKMLSLTSVGSLALTDFTRHPPPSLLLLLRLRPASQQRQRLLKVSPDQVLLFIL